MHSHRSVPRTFMVVSLVALSLAATVVVLGAYVRLSNAGLGCPDWPGCYGHPIVPDSAKPLVAAKAWKEMIHRYAAGTLGLLILTLFVKAWRNRILAWARPLTTVLLGLVVFQALLGMWTVTLKLLPWVVMGHLLGGLSVTALLLWLVIAAKDPIPIGVSRKGAGMVRLALIIVVGQIALGGWTSANYAAPACPDFPTCQGKWWPKMNFKKAIAVVPPVIDGNYEGGTLSGPARTAIHVTHRIGAVITLATVLLAAMVLFSEGVRGYAALLAAAVIAQFAIGVANVLQHFPLHMAVSHNGGAAVLLLAVVAVNLLIAGERVTVNRPLVVTAKS